jgi:hypothetical protein
MLIPYNITFLEPCKGEEGRIIERITCHRRLWCEIAEGFDYLAYQPERRADLIITNPPFSQALEFLQKSLAEADCVIYLLRLNFLESRKRRAFWQANPPTHLLALAERPCFTGDGRTDATGYGWFCWDKRGFVKLPPGVHVL